MTQDDRVVPPTVPVPRPVSTGTGRSALARHTAGQGSRRASPWYQTRPARPARPAPPTTVVPVKRAAALVEPLVVMVLGVTLGLVDQQATQTSGWLRVPALVASLILVAQAILTVEQRRHTPEQTHRDELVSESTEVVTVQQITTMSPGMATHSGQPAAKETVTTTKKVREGPQVMFFVMGLAVWLGLATLANPDAPRNLLLLSLLASFLLFAEAYKQMRGRS